MQNFMFQLLFYQQKTILTCQNYQARDLKRPIYWNEYKVTPNKTVEIAAVNDEKCIRELLDLSC